MNIKVTFEAQLPLGVTIEEAKQWIKFELCGGCLDIPDELENESLSDVVYQSTVKVEER